MTTDMAFIFLMAAIVLACWGLSLLINGDELDWLLTDQFYMALALAVAALLIPLLLSVYYMLGVE